MSQLQTSMTSILDLEFQLNGVDYTKKNFVHADMSPEEFAKTMKDRGESFVQMFFRLMGAGIAMQAKNGGGTSDFEVVMAFLTRDSRKLKQIMADQFENIEGTMMALEGPEGSTIIGERNRKAFEVLARELKAGKKKIGVFYGAGHLPDMEKRLKDDFAFTPQGRKWLTAWNLGPKKPRGDTATDQQTEEKEEED